MSFESPRFDFDPSPVRVKVCGLTTLADALATAEAGADWLGLNFHPASPRCISIETAARIVEELPPSVDGVGLFVDRPPDEVIAIARRAGLTIVQLHGDEPPSDALAMRNAGLRVMRAFRLADAESIARMSNWLAEADHLNASPEAVLIDAHVPGRSGGTGQTIESIVLDLLPPLPQLILAGGLTPENVAERVARVRPWMVDVASGVESSPGRKDITKVNAFIRAARGV